jgi:hypothetical protein
VKDTAKGYKLAEFADAFGRYLPEPAKPSVTPSQANESGGFCASTFVTRSLGVTDENAPKANVYAGCDGVTDGGLLRESANDGDVQAEEETWTV